jgi:hypothetical protein
VAIATSRHRSLSDACQIELSAMRFSQLESRRGDRARHPRTDSTCSALTSGVRWSDIVTEWMKGGRPRTVRMSAMAAGGEAWLTREHFSRTMTLRHHWAT